MWFFIPIPRVRRRCYYRSRAPQRPGPLTGVPDRVYRPMYVTVPVACAAMFGSLAVRTGPWAAVLSWVTVAACLVGFVWSGVRVYQYKQQRRPTPSPPPPAPTGWEPPDPPPGPRPVNRQAPIDRPYPFRPY